MTATMIGLFVLVFAYLIFMVILTQIKHDTSIANFTWGWGVMLVAIYTLIAGGTYFPRQILITLLTVIWATRLIILLYMRYTGKDPRFAGWKMQGAKALIFNLAWIFIGQLALLIIMSIPVFSVNTSNYQANLNYLDFIGSMVWLFGFSFEAISDYELYQFLKNPANKGHILKSGLWQYSRHPNYFGESVLWWGIFLIALANNIENAFATIISPIVITFLLRFVTGVPLLENAMRDNPEYQEYKKHTNIFIPWLKK